MIHGAEGLSRKNRLKARQFIASVATTLNVQVPNSRAALLPYNEIVGPVITFDKYKDLKKFYDDLYRLPAEEGKNQINLALSEANKQIFSSESREAVSRVGVLLNFGKALDIEKAQIAVAELNSKGVKLFIVHVGTEQQMAPLLKLVSNKENLFHASSIDDLMGLVTPLHDKIVSESGNYSKMISCIIMLYNIFFLTYFFLHYCFIHQFPYSIMICIFCLSVSSY